MEESINLRNFLGQHVLVTYQDGIQEEVIIRTSNSRLYPIALKSTTCGKGNPFTYTEYGQILMFNENDEDIVSVKSMEKSKTNMKNNLNFEQYLCGRVRVTYRNGSQAEGRLGYNSEVTKDQWPFKFFPTDNSLHEATYTEDGHFFTDRDYVSDIMSIETLDPVNIDGRESAIEKMALALLPAVFTSLESDPNLDEAFNKAIRGVFLAMFGGDVSGGTLDLSVSVIRSRIALSLKQ